MCVFNTEMTAFLGAASSPIPLWLAHMAWNLFGDPRVDILGRCGSFFSHDFGLPRTGSSSALHSGSLDSLHFVPGHLFLLGVGLGFKMEWAETSRTFWPHKNQYLLFYQNYNLEIKKTESNVMRKFNGPSSHSNKLNNQKNTH